MKMTDLADVNHFSSQGVLALRGFIPRKQVELARRCILAELERLKLSSNGKILSSKIQDLPFFQQTVRLGQLIGPKKEVDRLFSEELIAVMKELAESNLKPAQPSSQILLSFPQKAEWSLKNLNWHLDLSAPKINHIPGLQAFVLIDDVVPQGGATLALAGSHKLHYMSYEEGAHNILKKSNFGSQPELYLDQQTIRGVPLQIVEMAGRAGDVFIMDLRVLHSPSLNVSRRIRMMATNRYLIPNLEPKF